MRRTIVSLLRYLIAFLLTLLPLPTFTIAALMYTVLVGRLLNSFWLVVVGILAGTALLVHRLDRDRPPLARWAMFSGWVIAWCSGLYLTAGDKPIGEVPRWLVLLGFALGSMWIPWLGWMFAFAFQGKTKAAVLGSLLGLGLILSRTVSVGQLTGDEQLEFFWKSGGGLHAGPRVPTTGTLEKVDVEDVAGEDFPQFLGPRRDGRIDPSPPWASDWNSALPELVWRIEVGPAWSSFAIVGTQVITQEQRGEQEVVASYDIRTGTERWNYSYPAFFPGAGSGEGPRATPTVAGNRVYAVGATGRLHALELDTGKLVWSRDILADAGTRLQEHGNCGSPLIVSELVIACPSGENGPSLAAYRVADGSLVWKVGERGPSYASPMLVDILGQETVLHLDGEGLHARNILDGSEFWSHAWSSLGNNATQPVIAREEGDRILLASYDVGGATMLQITRDANSWKATPLWTKPVMKTKFSTPVMHEGSLYGLDNGILECLNVETGSPRWKKGRYKHGQVLLAGTSLIVLTEDGKLVLVQAQPDQWTERGMIDALEGKTWNTLAAKGNLLVVRNAREAACFRMPVAAPVAPSR